MELSIWCCYSFDDHTKRKSFWAHRDDFSSKDKDNALYAGSHNNEANMETRVSGRMSKKVVNCPTDGMHRDIDECATSTTEVMHPDPKIRGRGEAKAAISRKADESKGGGIVVRSNPNGQTQDGGRSGDPAHPGESTHDVTSGSSEKIQVGIKKNA